jgi:YesN/AraC family two-component response regulator
MEEQVKRKIRVLIFDDDEPIRVMLSRLMKMRGYDYMAFEDPSVCPLYNRDKCSCNTDETCADIIISDIKMPMVNGMDFIEQQLGKACRIGEPNIALISGFWSAELKGRAAKFKIKTFMKPFSISDLEEWLDECETRVMYNARLMDL